MLIRKLPNFGNTRRLTVFSNGDVMAAGFLQVYEEAGKQLPFIMGQENMLAGQGLSPLTTNPISWSQESFKRVLSEEKIVILNQSLSNKRYCFK